MAPRKKKDEAMPAAAPEASAAVPSVPEPAAPAPLGGGGLEAGLLVAPSPAPIQQLNDKVLEVLQARADSLSQESVEAERDETLAIMLFALGEEWYSVRLESVREIYSGHNVTRVPCVEPHVLGVINVRGEIISVTDLKGLLRLPAGEPDPETPMIVVQNDDSATALVVDGIGEIVEVPVEDLQPPLTILDKTQAEFVTGSVYIDGKLVALINMDKVLTPVGAEAGKG